ncbi:YncE family protein [Chromobacterium haemolyticum]|uniref:YncE family protein n=1 Tax=Chromobacterium haemolyticum TaxID=394935 RepID=UPI0013B3C093|nr:lactonase family protein [Chromobacterium haemolyticum]
MKLKHAWRKVRLTSTFSIIATTLGMAAYQAVVQAGPTLPQAQLLTLPGSPFGITASTDSHWLFVGLSGAVNGIAIVNTRTSSLQLARVVKTNGPIFGVALSRDGRYLAAVVNDHNAPALLIFDAGQLAAGKLLAPVASVSLPPKSGPINVAWTPNGDLLAVAEETSGQVAIVDLRKAFAGADALISSIRVGAAPVGMAISNDGHLLYVTSQVADPSLHGSSPNACPRLGSPTQRQRQGSLSVIDLRLAQSFPKQAVQTQLAAGCQPVRVVLSKDEDVAWVTARGDNTVLALRTGRLADKGRQALISTTPVGTAPVGLALFDHGRYIAVANSNRFTTGQIGSLSVVSAPSALAGKGAAAVLRSFRAGEFPREIILSPDERSLYLGEYSSNVLARVFVSNLLAASRN